MALTAQIGDPILCHLGALAAFGHSVFPRGAYLAGHFQEYRAPGRHFGKGWIELWFDRLVLPGAEVLPLSAKVISVPHLRVDREGKIHGRGHPKRGAIGWAVPILWPVKVLTLPARVARNACLTRSSSCRMARKATKVEVWNEPVFECAHT